MEKKHRRGHIQTTTKTVELKIAVPTLPPHPLYTRTRKKISTIPKKTLVLSSIIGAIAIVSVSSYFLPASYSKTTANTPASHVGPVKENPTFPTVLPAGKRIEDLGGWTRISPPERNPVYTYVDQIESSAINVSQQPLPDDFKSNPSEKVEQLAMGFNAREKVTIGSTTAYIGTSAEGPQSVIFSKGDLLILIKSSTKVDANHWTQYINQLR